MSNTTDFENMTTDEKLQTLNASIIEMRSLLLDMAASNGLEDWVDLKTAMKITQLSKSTLYHLRKQNKISQSSITGKDVFLRRSDLISLLNEREKMRE